MPNETRTLKVGDEAPEISLRSTAGGVFKLSDQLGKNVVLAFFPAAFSGVCSQQMPQIQSKIGDFEASDAVVVGISVDNNWSQQAWSQQMGVSFPLLSDFFPHGAVSEKYGVLHAAGVAERAIIGIDKNGKVAYIEVLPGFTEIPDAGACLVALKG